MDYETSGIKPMLKTDIITNQGARAIALTLCEAGISLFPCDHLKRPLVKGGFKTASASPKQIKAWWRNWPDALIGIPTGTTNEISVLDLDFGWKKGKFKNGYRALKNLGYEYSQLSSFMQETPSGGAHIYFSHCQGLKSSADKIARGVDVRAEGGYVVFYGNIRDALNLSMETAIGLPEFPEELIPEESEINRGDNAELPIDQVRDALNACPNDGDEYGSRDDWLRVGMAVHAATGGSREGLIAWKEWSREHESYDADKTESAWRSFRKKQNGITASTLLAEARRHGWSDITAEDFEDDNETEAELPRGLQIVSPEECRDRRGSRPYVVKGLLAEGDIAAIIGAPGAGKSLLAPRIGYAVAQGLPVFGLKVRQGGVLYVAAEDAHGMKDRVAALYDLHGDAPDFGIVEGLGNLLDSNNVKALRRVVKDRGTRLILIDTLAMAFSGLEENDAASMGRVVAAARSLTKWGAAVVLIHHDTKAKDGLPRGHSILNGALDMSLHLTREGEFVQARPTKNRNGTCDLSIAFGIETRVLGHDEDGDEIRAAYADDAAGQPPRERSLPRPAAAALEELKSLGQPVSVQTWREACTSGREVSASENLKSRQQAFLRAVKDLLERKIIVQSGDIYSIRRKHEPICATDFEDDYEY
ncbi:AAA family ATPase [Frigidibacter sp.]|uniref:AAA family ATPase n=1 Tax=Frigidibacter sp. TaxID=2586418 RepID=UPI002736FAD5|nr:AAA family ATPase [Frigidibacter sp.]MDP3341492.1 AAA family ATPase [Frigidibacter sp.]